MLTNKEAYEFLGIFDSVKKIDNDYRLFMQKQINDKLKFGVDGELRKLYDECIFRAFQVYKDIKGATHIFYNQKTSIDNLTEYLSWPLIANEPWDKYVKCKTTIFDVLEFARNKDNHSIKQDPNNYLILYKQSFTEGHLTFIVKFIEGIMISRLNELTKEDKEKIMALDPNNIIWFENMKTFVKPFYKYLKELDNEEHIEKIKQMEELLNFELNPDNVKLLFNPDNNK